MPETKIRYDFSFKRFKWAEKVAWKENVKNEKHEKDS